MPQQRLSAVKNLKKEDFLKNRQIEVTINDEFEINLYSLKSCDYYSIVLARLTLPKVNSTYLIKIKYVVFGHTILCFQLSCTPKEKKKMFYRGQEPQKIVKDVQEFQVMSP